MLSRKKTIEPVPQPLPSRHQPGTDGAHDVHTPHVDAGLVTVGEAARQHGVCALYGPPGLGKTFTVLLGAALLGVPCRYKEPKPGVGHKAHLIELLHALEQPYDSTLKTDGLLDALVEACAVEQVLLLDEADREGHKGMEDIRYCLAQPTNRTTFVLVGYKIDRLIAANPALDSRMPWRHQYAPLEGEDLVGALRAYHAAFEDLDERLLLRIGAFTKGEFRRIAQVLSEIRARTPAGAVPRVTNELLDDVFDGSGRAWRGGARPASRKERAA